MAGKESHFQLALKTSVGSADHAERWDLGDRCVQGELSLATRSIRAEASGRPSASPQRAGPWNTSEQRALRRISVRTVHLQGSRDNGRKVRPRWAGDDSCLHPQTCCAQRQCVQLHSGLWPSRPPRFHLVQRQSQRGSQEAGSPRPGGARVHRAPCPLPPSPTCSCRFLAVRWLQTSLLIGLTHHLAVSFIL